MTQMIGEAGPAPRYAAPPLAAVRETVADRYRADWQPAPAPVRAAPATPAPPAAETPAEVNRSALLAADVYRADPAPPAGTRVATQRDLDRLGLTPEMLEQPGRTSFRARVYVSGAPGHEQYTIAFRGTQDGADWMANLQQGTGHDSVHYRLALAIGKQIARSGADVAMVGHSLGGGLAAAAALASGRHADTFNAAGLHRDTIAEASGIGRTAGGADNYRVPGEILTFVQEGGDRVIGALLGGAVGALAVDAPAAYGRQHQLSLVVPNGKGFFAEHSRVDRHGMDWVLAATAHAAR